jgi:hypothetical protein
MKLLNHKTNIYKYNKSYINIKMAKKAKTKAKTKIVKRLKQHGSSNVKMDKKRKALAPGRRISKNGKGWAIFSIEDYSDAHEFRIFGEDYLKFKHFL